MNRTRVFATLLAAIFMSAVGVGVAMGWDERPVKEEAKPRVTSTTTTTVRPTTTTRAPVTTTTTTTTTTVRSATTTTRPPTPVATTVAPTTVPPTTAPPVTTTVPPSPTTTAITYDPVLCARISSNYDNPNRANELAYWGCPARFY